MNPHIVIFSPVMPVWDKGAFCSPLTKLFLEKEFHVTLIDTLSLFSGSSAAIEVLPIITEKLKDRFQGPLLLVGFSMAGTLVQILAARLPDIQAVLAVNAPGYPDAFLQQRIKYLLSLLEDGDLSKALETLNILIQPLGEIKKRVRAKIPSKKKNMAIERMQRGFRLLLDMDARSEIVKYGGKFLALVGEKSQFATVNNQTQSYRLNHEYKIISSAGTRLWDDNPSMTYAIVNEWIDKL
ncbi:alpha/beta hydrolase [Bartonella sp. CB169]|uniref:alpha/beta hydrolase n=1 Tax=Bartonella sp. CB169 TaxID=3112257 RepID=UPI00300DED8E